MTYNFTIGKIYKNTDGLQVELLALDESVRPATVRFQPVGAEDVVEKPAYIFKQEFNQASMPEAEKAKRTIFRLYQEDEDRLQALARKTGGNRSAALRLAIKAAYNRLEAE